MSALVFDIETVGEKFDDLDETTQGVLTRWIEKTSDDEEGFKAALDDLKNGLGFSPLTGEIVAIGALDSDSGVGGVYYQDPKGVDAESEENGVKYRPMSEVDMLKQFWLLVDKYQEFVSFNGRGFDVPFLMVRSAIHGIRPSKDLLSNRYLSLQKSWAKHIDLLDQLTFYGAVRRRESLHLWTRAFGIESPKASGVAGDDVAGLFAAGEYLKIAKYNAGDIRATSELYDKWKQYLSF